MYVCNRIQVICAYSKSFNDWFTFSACARSSAPIPPISLWSKLGKRKIQRRHETQFDVLLEGCQVCVQLERFCNSTSSVFPDKIAAQAEEVKFSKG